MQSYTAPCMLFKYTIECNTRKDDFPPQDKVFKHFRLGSNHQDPAQSSRVKHLHTLVQIVSGTYSLHQTSLKYTCTRVKSSWLGSLFIMSAIQFHCESPSPGISQQKIQSLNGQSSCLTFKLRWLGWTCGGCMEIVKSKIFDYGLINRIENL